MRVAKGAPEARESAEVIPFATDGANLQMGQLIETLTETNRHLGAIASVGTDTLSFIKKWVPWCIAAAGVLWPTVGKIIAGLPPWPG